MSIWIFSARQRAFVGFVILLTGLTACTSSRLGVGNRTPAAQRTVIQVSSKNLVIQGPPGFCVDKNVTEIQGDNAFVLLGNCAVVSPSTRAAQPDVRALLTASVSGGAQGAASIRDSAGSMDSFFRSENGRTALSRNSDPGTVTVLDTFHKNDTFFIHARDTSASLLPGASHDYWRAYFDINEQIVSVSVIGFEEAPLSAGKGLSMVQQFESSMKSINGVPVAVPQKTPAPIVVSETTLQSAKPQTTGTGRTLMSVGFLRRLFGG